MKVFSSARVYSNRPDDPEKLACVTIVEATTHYDNPAKLLQVSSDLGDLMGGISINQLMKQEAKTVQDFLKSDGRTSDAHTTLIFFLRRGSRLL